MRRALGLLVFFLGRVAHAQDVAPPAPAEIHLESDTRAVETNVAAPPPEAPPPPPYKRTVVLDSSLGAMGFVGKFGNVAPVAPWLHAQLGYEVFRWLMILGEGELAFTDTSGTQDPPKTRAFPIFGFGGGARISLRFTDRIGAYLQPTAGLMKADVAHNALSIIGFKNAESFGLYAGARLGVEWFQLDRHFALGANAGLRLATSFAKQFGGDTPLAIDGGASIRYAF